MLFRAGGACLLLVCALAGCSQSDSELSLDIPADLAPAPRPAAEAVARIDSPGEAPRRELLRLEKSSLKLGFIKLTDCAPVVIAREQGFFADEGLQVEVVAQPNWKTLLDNVINGELDGAHMLSGQPIAASIGIGTPAAVVTAYTLDQNGNAITVSNSVWEAMQQADEQLRSPRPPHPISAKALKPLVATKLASGEKLQMAMVFPVSTHNYELRYWLAAAGIHPGLYSATDVGGRTDAEVELSVTPPPMMPATLESGNIQGYCVGEPWNQQAVLKGIGVPVITNFDIYQHKAEKVFGVTRKWAQENPQTHLAVVKALIRAGRWLDETDSAGKLINREEAARILSRPDYVGADFDVIRNSMTGFFYFQKSDRRELPEFNVFFHNHASYPWYSDGIWFLTQMRRWGQIPEAKPAQWYHNTVKEIYLPEVYQQAARLLVQEGKLTEAEVPWNTDGYKPPSRHFIDGLTYDGRDPIGYLNSHQIGIKDPAQ